MVAACAAAEAAPPAAAVSAATGWLGPSCCCVLISSTVSVSPVSSGLAFPPLLLPTGCCSCCCCCCCHGPAQKREVFTVLPLLDRQLGPLAGGHERSVQIERRARSGERTLLGPKETAAAAGRLPAAPHPFPTPQPWGGV